MIIVLTGIDGSGKSTAAHALVSSVEAHGGKAVLLNNHAGRRTMSVLSARTGIRLPKRLAEVMESTFRVWNVLVSHLRASRSEGLVVMDRHLYCQLALRTTKGLPRGRFLPWLLKALPAADAVVHFDIDPGEAHRRIVSRGTDDETLEDLIAFRDAYRQLTEYKDFVKVDASLPPAELARQLDDVVTRLQARRAERTQKDAVTKRK